MKRMPLAFLMMLASLAPNTLVAAEDVREVECSDTKAPAKEFTLAQLRAGRKRLAQRQRKIIFNNDGCDAVYYCDKATPEALLKCRTSDLIGTQVDTISYCTWCSGFGYFTHRTKLGDVFTETSVAGAPNKIGFSNNKVGAFLQQGTDPLEIMVDFCKRNDIEIWWSMRMNDTHDRYGAWYSPYLYPPLKKKHPDWVIQPDNPRVTAVNYALPEVRDMALAFIREVCENYDVDGVDLDFYRHLLYFPCNAEGKDAGQEECAMMTDLMRRVRAMTEEVGLKRGRPILVSIRVPDSVGYCKAKGFDIVRWMEEGLIDTMEVSGYVRLNPWKTSAELAHRHEIPVYACLSETRMKQRGPRRDNECYRGRAVNAWDAGMDGIYLFNAFNPNHPLWSELGDPAALKTKTKVFTTGSRGVANNYLNQWLTNGKRFLNRDPVSPERTRALKPGKPVTIALTVGQQLDSAAGKAPKIELRLWVTGKASPDDLVVELNGKPLAGGANGKSEGWTIWPIEPNLICHGTNRFQIALNQDSPASKATLKDLLLWVRY